MPMEPKTPIRKASLYKGGKIESPQGFGQTNTFQGFLKFLAAQHKQKPGQLLVYFFFKYIRYRLTGSQLRDILVYGIKLNQIY